MPYDPTTTIGKVRLLIADTDYSNLVFTDDEITAFLSMVGGIVELAAARAFGALVRSKAMLSKVIQRDGYRSEQHALNELLAVAKGIVDEYNATAGLQTAEIDLGDDFFESFRPGWRDVTGDPVVE